MSVAGSSGAVAVAGAGRAVDSTHACERRELRERCELRDSWELDDKSLGAASAVGIGPGINGRAVGAGAGGAGDGAMGAGRAGRGAPGVATVVFGLEEEGLAVAASTGVSALVWELGGLRRLGWR